MEEELTKSQIDDMLVIANSFCNITNFKNKSILHLNNAHYLIAYIVNAAFSLEMCFKYLYSYNTYLRISGHELKKLYNKAKTFGLEEYLLTGFTKTEIEKILTQLNNSFYEWRYSYELNKYLKVDLALMKDILISVINHCNSIGKGDCIC